MPKHLFHSKSLEKQKEEAINRLPHNDNQTVEDVKIYSSMSADELNKLQAFCDDGSVKFYPVGNSFLSKLSLIKFVKSLKNR